MENLEKPKFEVVIWENIYPIQNGKVLLEVGSAGKHILYKTFNTLEKANEFYQKCKPNKPIIENNNLIMQEKLLVDNRWNRDYTIKKIERKF